MQTEQSLIQTEEFVLRPIYPSDDQAIFAAFTKEVSKYLPIDPPENISGTRAFIRKVQEDSSAGKELVWAIEYVDTGRFMGCCGLHKLNSSLPEIGIWLAAPSQNRGFGKKVVEQLITYAREILSLTHICYPVADENLRSIAVVESLGGILNKTYILSSQKTLNVREYLIKT